MPNKEKYELLKELMIKGHLDVNWALKNILGFDTKSEYRKSKINKLFRNEE
jgi:hypothetical protein